MSGVVRALLVVKKIQRHRFFQVAEAPLRTKGALTPKFPLATEGQFSDKA